MGNSLEEGIIVKASFQKCPLKDRAEFGFSKCLMPISIGQKCHEGDKLSATIELVNRSFKSCVILIDDSVQRHTLNIISPEKKLNELYEQSIREGDGWLLRNKHIVNSIKIPFYIIRWDKWLYHENFNLKYEKVDKLYNNNASYRESIDINIQEYVERFKKKGIAFDEKHAFSCCLNYLKEECAGMCLWIDESCEFELYPSGRNHAMQATYDLLIKPYYPNLLRSVGVRFKKYRKKMENPVETSIILV